MAAWLVLLGILAWRAATGSSHHQGAERSFCERDWHPFGDRCYRILGLPKSEQASWDEATKKCAEFGGQLATIYSQELQEYVNVFLQLEAAASVWIGLNDRANEEAYEWQDRALFNFTKWGDKEPSGPKDEKEDCVEMVFFSRNDDTGNWNDLNCDWKRSYLCQVDRKATGARFVDPRFCKESSGGGWRLHDSCFQVVHDAKPWAEAEAWCADRYRGHLATVNDWTVDVFLELVLRGHQEQGFWIGVRSGEAVLRWSSGWPVSPQRLKFDGLTASDLPPGSCLSVGHSGHWQVDSCQRALPFVCETSVTTGTALEPPPKLKAPPHDGFHCPQKPSDWFDVGGEYCYSFPEKYDVSWYEANFICFRRGGFLISFHSLEEVTVISQFFKYTTYVLHIGLYRPLDSGLLADGVFEWTDGSAVDFKHWGSGEPNSHVENCTEMFGETTFWNDMDCGSRTGYLCSVLKIPPNSSVDGRDGKGSCRHGLSWTEAVGLLLCAALVMALFGAIVYRFRRQEVGPDSKDLAAASRAQRYRSGELIVVREDTDCVNLSY